MKFQLDTSGSFYPSKKDRKELETLGFKFEPSDFKEYVKADNPELSIDIKTLDDLLAFVAQHGRVILDKEASGDYSIEIYDDYRE